MRILNLLSRKHVLNDRFVSKDVRESGTTPGFFCRIARDFFINLDYIRYYLLDIQSGQCLYKLSI